MIPMPMPPDGPVDQNRPGYHDTRTWIIYMSTSICFGIIIVLVSLRIWVRRFILHRMGIDDWLAIISLLLVIGEGIAMLFSAQFGLGRHLWAIPKDHIWLYIRSLYVTIVLYTGAILAIKLTLIFQYYRVLAVQYMRKWYIGAIVLITIWGVAQIFLCAMWCVPIEGLWDPKAHSKCIPTYPQVYVNAAGNIITDVVIILLPMPAILKLKIPLGQKVLLVSIFSLGFLTVAISGVRIHYINSNNDYTWVSAKGSSWSLAELTCGLACACLPTLKLVLYKIFPSLCGSASKVSSHDLESSGSVSKRPLFKVTGMTTFTSTTQNHENDDDLAEVIAMQYQLNPVFPFSYVAQHNSSAPVGPAQILKIQQNIGMTCTAIIEISATPLQEHPEIQDGTIQITKEVNFTTT